MARRFLGLLLALVRLLAAGVTAVVYVLHPVEATGYVPADRP